jgi:predicted RNA-binding Zn-ribbon protein involved in translation (DUF1610 family)
MLLELALKLIAVPFATSNCGRIDLCTACRRPFQVDVFGDDRSNPKETVELVCPNCGEVFTEQSRGVLLTSTMPDGAEAEWEKKQSSA